MSCSSKRAAAFRKSVAVAGAVLGLLLPVRAMAFGTSTCTPGPLFLGWNPIQYQPMRFALPRDRNSLLLANNTYYYALIRANPRVSTVSFQFAGVNMNAPDSVSFPFLANPQSYTGVLGPFSTPAFASEGTPGWWGHINISTDSATPSAGFSISTATVACNPEGPAPNATEAWVEKKNIGILTQTGDTMYYSYPAPPNNVLGQPYHLHAALNYGVGAPGFDFDLYARCGAFPTATSYDYIGYSGTPREFIDITTPCATQWYFAINAYSGAGIFDLTIGEGGDETKCFAFDSSSGYTTAEKTAISDQFVNGLGAFYGVTLGGLLINRATFIDGDLSSKCVATPGYPATDVDGMFSKTCGQSSTAGNAGQTTYCTSADWSGNLPFIVSHELAHHMFQLPDEYQPADVCGHSLMGSPTMANFISVCTAANHAKDPLSGSYVDPGNSTYSTTPYGNQYSMWQKLSDNHYEKGINFTHYPSPSGPPRMLPVNTVENYSYSDYDFNSYLVHVQKVVQYQ